MKTLFSKKRYLWAIITVHSLLLLLVLMIPIPTFAGIITDPNEAALKWNASLDAVATPPILVDGDLYCTAGNHIYRIDSETGEVTVGSAAIGSIGYTTNAITYANNRFYVQTNNNGGSIAAVTKDLSSVEWTATKDGNKYTPPGQVISPIIYDDSTNTIFSGSWKGETESGSYFCLDADTGELVWEFTPPEDEEHPTRGFYWAGAYVSENYLAVGCDDGREEKDFEESTGTLFILDKRTGQVIDQLDGVRGDIRTSVVYDQGKLYFTSKGGQLYQVSIDMDGNLGTPIIQEMSGAMTATPVIIDELLYVGISGEGADLSSDGGQAIAIVDTTRIGNVDAVRKVETPGYVQCAITPYRSSSNEAIFYYTVNSIPGGIEYLRLDGTDYETGTLFTPPEGMQEYCLTPVLVDDEGTLYYANDSKQVFAVAQNTAYATDIQVSANEGSVKWNRHFKTGLADYSIQTTASEVTVKPTVPEGQDVSITVDGKEATDGIVELSSNPRTVEVTVTNGEDRRVYTLILQIPSDLAELESLAISESNIEGSAHIDVRNSSTTYYTVYQSTIQNNFYRLWLNAKGAGTVAVTAIDNIKTLSDRDDYYAVYLTDMSKNGRVKVTVTSEDKKNKKEYTVVFNRTISGATISGISNKTYSGKTQSPVPTVRYYGVPLTKGDDYTVSYSGNKNIGTAKVTITGRGDFAGTTIKTFQILPGKGKISKISAGKKKITATYTKVAGGCSYQVGYRIKGGKWKYKTTSKTKLVLSKLKSKKTYEVKVRAYKKVSGKTYYGAWSSSKTVKVK